jgi:hypothetical protein
MRHKEGEGFDTYSLKVGTSDHSQEDLTKFGYRPNVKVEVFLFHLYFG